MANVSVKRVDRDEFEREIEDKTVEGWTVKSRNENLAVMSKPGGWGSAVGHLLVFIVLGWWTLLIGNLIYALFAHAGSAQELHIKVDD
ncbi:hypothetical protein [Methanolobus bombayensis]|uniref:hypothetical protein n=1 Tax=Methanolobus bombayensis TaxID=38023 RepID=UPI001AEA8914|nr:hypothetical protein [Methanolobus bombayensis]MBP1909725.1 hypothetical protein [Methanolobus bombayensis]